MSLIESIQSDLNQLYTTWMGLIYQSYNNPHSVLGTYSPDTVSQLILFRMWSVLGILATVISYPLALSGIVILMVMNPIGEGVKSLGINRSVLSLIGLWFVLIGVMIYLYGVETSIGVILAVIVAIISCGVAIVAHKMFSRRGMVIVGYPAIYTAIFLPPITAALVAPIGDSIITQSVLFAEFVLDSVVPITEVEQFIRNSFELEGEMHLLLWFIISCILGWATGIIMFLGKLIKGK